MSQQVPITNKTFTDSFQENLEKTVKEAVNREIEKEIEEAKARIEQTFRDQADQIALRFLSYYHMSQDERRLISTVDKGEDK